jgi:8-oxo-dGTP diphosphatase
VLLVHRKKYDDWSLPKGKVEPGEALPVTAVREVLEEGGARLALGRRLVSVRYSVGGRPKRVHYWAARVLSVDSRAIPNEEVDEIAWLPAERAVEKVSYAHDHGVLADFAARPPQTFPLILLRHAKALPKGNWKRADAGRPLDDSGRYSAKALADLLACFAPSFQLITSPAARCAETLRPLAELTGDPVREAPSLYVHHKPITGAADSGTVNAALIRAAVESGKPTVICAHRENLQALREAALAALTGYSFGGKPASKKETAGGEASGTFELPKDWDDALPTAGFWVLNIAPSLAAEPDPASRTVAEPESAAEAGTAAQGFPAPEPSAPEPSAPEPSAPEPSAAESQVPAGPARGRTWWQRLRTPARRDGARREDTRDAGDGAADQVSGISAQHPATVRPITVAGDDGPSGGPGATQGDTLAGDAAAGDAAGGDAAAARPVGVLISADRYDISDLAES